MTNEWQDTPEDDGITLGPEEALEREISKSKSLKVERLQLKDQVERLAAENQALRDENEILRQKRQGSPGGLEHSPDATDALHSDAPPPANRFLPNRWAFFLLVFNLAAIGILLVYLLQNPSP
jgi:hypothetical protein